MRDVRPEILAFAKSPQEKLQLEILMRELVIGTIEPALKHESRHWFGAKIAKLERQITELKNNG